MRISFDGIQVEDCPVAVGQPGDTFQQIICRKAIQYGCIRVFNLFAIFINRGTQPESIVFTEIFECRRYKDPSHPGAKRTCGRIGLYLGEYFDKSILKQVAGRFLSRTYRAHTLIMAGAYSSYNSLRADVSPRLHPSINSCSSINTCYSLIV